MSGNSPHKKYLSAAILRRYFFRTLRDIKRAGHAALNMVGRTLQTLHDHVLPNFTAFTQDRTLITWALAIAAGIMVGYAAILFRLGIGLFQLPWLGTMSERVADAAADLSWFIILLAPMCGGLIVGLFLEYFMPGKRAQAVADVIEARALKSCHIPLRTGLANTFVSMVSLGTGASAGREGPVVHLGASLASSLRKRFNLPRAAQRTLLGCGVAAAISASFNAPVAGVLFAHEVILGHYALRAFVPITLASVTGSAVAHIHLGNHSTFQIPDYSITSYWELPAFALLGLTCAFVAIIFQFALMYTDQAARTIQMPLWLRPVAGGFLVGMIAIFFPQILGVGYGVTDAALHESLSLNLLLTLIFAKTAVTAITLASRFGGGIFSPSLYLGAMTGGAFGLIAGSLFPALASSHGAYTIVGMGAVAAAVLGAPISTTLIVFELTGSYALTMALLLAVSMSHGIGQAFHGVSYFHWQLRNRGVFLNEGQHKYIVRSIRVSEFMTPLKDDETPPEIDWLETNNWLSKDHVAETALRSFDACGLDRLPVVEEDERGWRVIGWADHLACLHAVNQALVEAHLEEHK